MSENVFHNNETGGSSEYRRRITDAETSISKKTWVQRIQERLQRKHASKKSVGETKESHESFIRGIFDTEGSSRKNEQTKQSDEQKLQALSDQERTEFYMIVAQRFKDAGEKFMHFIHRMSGADKELAYGEHATPESEIREQVGGEIADDFDEHQPDQASAAPPFEFAAKRAPDIPDVHQEPTHNEELSPRDDEPSEAPTRQADELPSVIDAYVPVGSQIRIDQQEYTVYEHRSSAKEALIVLLAGGYLLKRRKVKRLEREQTEAERKHEREIKTRQFEADTLKRELDESQRAAERATTQANTTVQRSQSTVRIETSRPEHGPRFSMPHNESVRQRDIVQNGEVKEVNNRGTASSIRRQLEQLKDAEIHQREQPKDKNGPLTLPVPVYAGEVEKKYAPQAEVEPLQAGMNQAEPVVGYSNNASEHVAVKDATPLEEVLQQKRQKLATAKEYKPRKPAKLIQFDRSTIIILGIMVLGILLNILA